MHEDEIKKSNKEVVDLQNKMQVKLSMIENQRSYWKKLWAIYMSNCIGFYSSITKSDMLVKVIIARINKYALRHSNKCMFVLMF